MTLIDYALLYIKLQQNISLILIEEIVYHQDTQLTKFIELDI